MNTIVDKQKKEEIISIVSNYVDTSQKKTIRYIDLGVQVIRLVCYTPDVVPLLEKQFGQFCVEFCSHYESTIVVWKEYNNEILSEKVFNCLSKEDRIKIKAEMLWLRNKYPVIKLYENNNGGIKPIVNIDAHEGLTEVINIDEHVAFFGYYDFNPEKFVKQGHAFVRIINSLIKSEDTNLTHGAAFGINGNGILLCGRGKRGKSTLTVESMLDGFEYVSDDYQILHKTDKGLFAYPIYSIITLSYRMYNEMYDRFKGKFVCNNFTQDKYIFNINSYSEQFRTAYPIKLCLLPEIVSDEHPSIVPCSSNEKGRAIVQMIHSTMTQMDDVGDEATIRKLYCMLKNMPFYKFNLCNNIAENTAYLENYLKTTSDNDRVIVQTDNLLLDISNGLATILDIDNSHFVCMNKFATNLLLMILSGKNDDEILKLLRTMEDKNPNIVSDFQKYMKIISDRFSSILNDDSYKKTEFMIDYAEKSGYNLSILEWTNGTCIELIK